MPKAKTAAAKAKERYAADNTTVWVPRSLVGTVCILRDIYKVSKITNSPRLLERVDDALTKILEGSSEGI